MLSERTVKLMADLPMAIINSTSETPVHSKILLKYSKDGNLIEIKKLFDTNTIYRTKQYLEAFDEVNKII
jgi:hypothetical protein